MRRTSRRSLRLALPLALLLVVACALLRRTGPAFWLPSRNSVYLPAMLPTGAWSDPLATPGASFQELFVEQQSPGAPDVGGLVAGQPAALAVSPDGRLLLTLTSGFNRVNGPDGARLPEASTEWLFVHGLGASLPRRLQAIPVPNAFKGLAWAPDGARFFASGGVDDVVHEYAARGGLEDPGAKFEEVLPPIPLGHRTGLGRGVKPLAAGLAVDPAGGHLLVANYENDSITVVDLARRAVSAELELRPGRLDPRDRGLPGGAFPVAVAFTGPGLAWVACARDREVVQVDLRNAVPGGLAGGPARVRPRILARVRVGEQPVALLAAAGALWVANSGDDTVSRIDPAQARVTAVLPVLPANLSRGLRGANPNALALSADGRALLVSLGGLNGIAELPLDGAGFSLLPTGWYPDAVAVDPANGRTLVATARSPTGPNPGACLDKARADSLNRGVRAEGSQPPKARVPDANCRASNQYVWQLAKGMLASYPARSRDEAARLTQVAIDHARLDRQPAAGERELFAALRRRIRHVIYVVKENRTYDQVLGDLAGSDGDPALALFPEPITPNHHALARGFVALDRFFVSGQVSGDGWNWSTAGRTSHITEQLIPVQYGGRGGSYDYEGTNRNVNVSLPMAARRAQDPRTPDDDDLLPGTADVARPGGESGSGYLWSAALRAGLEVRNYGFFADDSFYDPKEKPFLPPSRRAFAEQRTQFVAADGELRDRSDPWFRSFDMRVPDLWNLEEWEREFAGYAASGTLPALSLVRLAHDHLGQFGDALAGVDTPDTQMADNDYALGRLVEGVAHSPFAQDTVVLALEDDAQDGPDHVDSHRSFLLAAGAHVRQGAKSSRPATTVDVLRTIEELLGLQPLGLTDGNARPLAELFEPPPPEGQAGTPWSYTALVPEVLRSTRLELPPRGDGQRGGRVLPRGDGAGWARATRGLDFSTADAIEAGTFNRVLEEGLRVGGR